MTGHDARNAYAVVAAVLGPGIPILTWLLVTYSYRQDKLMIVREASNHLSEEDLGPDVTVNPVGVVVAQAGSTAPCDSLGTDSALSDQTMLTSVAAGALMQETAKQIAIRSLRQWDGFLGLRAGQDGLGNPLGVWKGKFDGVRFSVLLLAMHKLNDQLKVPTRAGDPPPTGSQPGDTFLC